MSGAKPSNTDVNPVNGTSELFNAPDADLVFRSSDHVLFHIHSKNIGACTGGFAPAEFTTSRKEVIDLPETAPTLELMFQFVYPRPQPLIAKLDFDALASLAEAVEKYQVYPARQVCNTGMAKVLPEHALEVLEYAVKHNYPELSDEAARPVSLVSVADRAASLPPHLVQAWLRYHAMWTCQRGDMMSCLSRHSCNSWPRHQHLIMENFWKCSGIPSDEKLAAVVSIPDKVLCCQEHVLLCRTQIPQLIQLLPPFTKFLADGDWSTETTKKHFFQ